MGFGDALQENAYGRVNPQLICPHCGVGGKVRMKSEKRKKGISGGKATGAVLTGGLSVLATGLSRKEKGAQLHCGSCQVTWHV